MEKNWIKFILNNKWVYVKGVVILFLWTLLIWTLSQTLGDGTGAMGEWLSYLDWTVLFLVILTVIYLFRRINSEEDYRKKAYLKGTAGFIGSVIAGVFLDLVYQFILPLFDMTYDVNIVYFDIQLPSWMTNTVSYTFLGILIAFFFTQQQVLRYRHYLEMKVKELEKYRLEQLNKSSQLQALQSKINPHFLYNSLNSVATLVGQDAKKAEDMIVSLSELFRHHINPSNRNFLPINEEMEMIETYLSIEKIRFGDHLHYSFDIEKGCEDVELPSMVLQPLIENAIKHGTSTLENGQIAVRIYKDGAKLVMEVGDNGADFKIDATSGHGLENVKSKLKLLYGDNFELNIQSNPTKQVQLKLGQVK